MHEIKIKTEYATRRILAIIKENRIWFYFPWVDLQTHGCLIKMKWNESDFRPPLCTYRLNWARKTSWGWWDDWDDTVLQTQDSKFEPWWSEAEHATSRSRRLPTILTFTHGWGRNIFCFLQTAEPGNRTPNSGVKTAVSTTTLGPPPGCPLIQTLVTAHQCRPPSANGWYMCTGSWFWSLSPSL